MEIITSKSNEKVKLIKNLNEKKFRTLNNCFYLEGVKVVEEVLNDKAVDIMFIALSDEILKHTCGGTDILSKLNYIKDLNVYNIKKEIFESITDTKSPQGILAVIKIKKYSLEEVLSVNSNLILLDKVQDLGNIGTIIRTADAFNVKGIICMEGTADVYSPKVIRSTMGSILREKITYIKEDMLNEIVDSNFNIIGTDLNTNKTVEDINFLGKSIFVFGNESKGVSSKVKNICTDLVKIDMSDSAESLNVSVACGIILHSQYKK